MVVFTPDSIKHVITPGLTIDDYKRLWSLVIRILTNSAKFYPFFNGSACAPCLAR